MLSKILEVKSSKYNGKIEVVKILGSRTVIKVDELTQSGGVVDSVWKSTLRKIHNTKFDIQNTLILGLGGGSAAKAVRRYYPDAKITGVEIDPVMIELGTRYLALGTSGVEIVIEDAFDFIRRQTSDVRSRFDLILVDLYVGYEIPEKFETERFVSLARRGLVRQGVVVFNRLYFGERRTQAVKFGKRLEKVFRKVDYFYPEANLMLICNGG